MRNIILRKFHDYFSNYFLHQNLIMENYNIMCGDKLLSKLVMLYSDMFRLTRVIVRLSLTIFNPYPANVENMVSS